MTRLVFVSIFTFLYNNFLILSQVPSVPKILDAKNVSRSSFIADWGSVSGAIIYSIHVSDRLDFTSSVAGIAEGVSYESLANVHVLGVSEVEISGLEVGVYYYRVRAVSLAGSSNNSSAKRISLFKEAIGFSDRTIISDEYVIPSALDVGDIDRDGKNDIVSLSYNFRTTSDNNFIWNKQFLENSSVFDSKGESIVSDYYAKDISIVDVSGGEYKDFINENHLFIREGDNFIKRDLGFSGISKTYDIDGDGMDDIVFYSSNRLGWLRNEGDGNLSSSITIATLDSDYDPHGFVLKDIDNDGDVDIIINESKKEIKEFFPGTINNFIITSDPLPSVDYEASRLILYENLGGYNFRERRPFKVLKGRGIYTWDPNGFIIEDIDNDGLQDVVIGANIHHESLGSSNYWYRQRENLLSFHDPIEIPGDPQVRKSIKSIDINRDGHMDILSSGNRLILYTNDGDGVSFSKSHNFGYSIVSVIDDLDGDGFQDVIYSDITKEGGHSAFNDDTGRVYWNRGSLVYAPVVKIWRNSI